MIATRRSVSVNPVRTKLEVDTSEKEAKTLLDEERRDVGGQISLTVFGPRVT